MKNYVKLEVREAYCLYSHGNYVDEFESVDDALDYIRDKYKLYSSPVYKINDGKYTILKSNNIIAEKY